ncbi:YgdB family protein [Rahnella contaminans]|uniref:YgdB family protein n=1 Tax=Rahnella contaminans TaxID=2703882 RepID=UPI003C2DDC7E
MKAVVNFTGAERQRGSALILSVMVMMGLGLIALNSLQQQLSAGLALTSSQHRFVIAWENASTVLAWGVQQSWKASTGSDWQCQDVAAGLLISGKGRVCVRPSLRPDLFLLRGEGQMAEGGEPVMQFQQASVKNKTDGTLVFIPLKQGWLDFCPETNELICNG